MKTRLFARVVAVLLASVLGVAQAATELRVMVHSSFSLPKPMLAQFESQTGIQLVLIKGGDAGEMLNKLILTRARPIADVVYGIDNSLLARALAAGVVDADALADDSAGNVAGVALARGVAAVDYGFVNINYDRRALEKSGKPLPSSLQDLTRPEYKGWLVVPNPATSSTGFAFLLATIAGMGEQPAFAWWAAMRANGLKVAKGWSEAYYTEFSRNKGRHPLVVSYATSPAAEVFYSKEKLTQSPTASLNLPGGVFRQVEGVAVIKGGVQAGAAAQFADFLRSVPVQQALQTDMWMYPALAGVSRAEVMRHAPEPSHFETLPAQTIAERGAGWVARWTQTVLK